MMLQGFDAKGRRGNTTELGEETQGAAPLSVSLPALMLHFPLPLPFLRAQKMARVVHKSNFSDLRKLAILQASQASKIMETLTHHSRA